VVNLAWLTLQIVRKLPEQLACNSGGTLMVLLAYTQSCQEFRTFDHPAMSDSLHMKIPCFQSALAFPTLSLSYLQYYNIAAVKSINAREQTILPYISFPLYFFH
jgi:hypothetical protein